MRYLVDSSLSVDLFVGNKLIFISLVDIFKSTSISWGWEVAVASSDFSF